MAKAGKFVLIVGDEGAILTYFQAGKVIRRLFAPSSSYTDTRGLLECLEADPKAPIYMLVDVMDQSYVQQTLPPVSSLSINNLIKRKMERDFAAEDLKGALQIGREKEGRKDWKYLFVTLSHSPQLQSWIDLVIDLPNHFKGIYLVPVEAENFVHQLRQKITGKKVKKGKAEAGEPRWQLIVTHNKVGGFRQVVLNDGKLIFARLAQPIGDSKPDVIAGSIEQEVSVTVEYLKRLGYGEDQGLEFFAIVADGIKSHIDPANIQATAAYLLSPHETAELLGMEQVTEPTDQFADVLLSAAFVRAKGHLLKLETEQSQHLNKLYAANMGVKAVGVLGVMAALGAIGFYGIKIPTWKDELDSIQSKTRSAEIRLADVLEKEKENLPEDLERITDLVDMHQLLTNLGESPLTALQRFKRFLQGKNAFVANITWRNEDTLLSGGGSGTQPGRGRGGAPAQAEQPPKVTFNVALDVYETGRGTKDFNQYITNEFTPQLEAAFPDYDVLLETRLPGDQADEEIRIGLDAAAVDPLLSQKYFTLQYTLTGPKPPEDEPVQG